MTQHYPNFYENISEVEKRLTGTVVLYDDEPYYILCAAEHPDGIIRVYLSAYNERGMVHCTKTGIPHTWHTDGTMTRQKKMDAWMEANPGLLLRKMMNSPSFKRFRPFPLGMCNESGNCYYVERNPTRHTQQGLTQDMLSSTKVRLIAQSTTRRGSISLMNMSMYDCIKGVYPSIDECLTNLNDDKIENDSVGFHRDFAFLRGPMELMFLAYKTDVVGVMPNGDVTCVKVGKQFRHVREAIDDLQIFRDIR